MMKDSALITRLAILASLVLVAGTALLPISARAADTVGAHMLMSQLEWRSVGPSIGGRVVAVDGVANQPNLFYMGAVDGGVWRSTNYGISWTNISDGWPSASDSIGALAVAPSNPEVIYAGTGESDIRGDMITGDGIYKSGDAGKTWAYAGLRDAHTTMGLIVDPKNPDVVYAASMGHVFVPDPQRGVFKTTDGGQTWNKILFVNDKTGVVDLVMDPTNSAVLYAAAWQAYRVPGHLDSGGPGSGLYKTTDGGAHWTNITDRVGLPKGILGKIGIAISASQPNVVYAAIQAKDGGVFRSKDGGTTWTNVNDQWELRQRAFYYMAIFVDPKDPDTVYMPQVDALFVSHDGGKHFQPLHTPHGDNHIVWINPHNTDILLEGNDGGATVSTDAGKTWSGVHNQPTGQFYRVALDDQFPFHIYGAQQDEGSIEGPNATAGKAIPLSAWHRVAGGESNWIAPQPGNPKITYGSSYFSTFHRYDSTTEEFQSVSPWPFYQDAASSAEEKYRFAWTHPILFSPTNRQELLIGSQYVMTSTDYGKTWQTISPDLTRNEASTEGPSGGPIDLDHAGTEIYPTVSALAVSPLDGQVIWAGSSDGLVHVTTDGGAHWQAAQPSALPEWSDISSIEPSHQDKGTAWLTASRYMRNDFKPYVFRTTDYGHTWQAVTTGLPNDQYTLAVRQDPDAPNLLFLGTKNTVYVSFDAGANWQSLTLNLPTVVVMDLAINTREGALVAATHGRAFWVLDNLALLEQISERQDYAVSTADLFAPQSAWLTHSYGTADRPRGAQSAGETPPFGATVFFRIPQQYDGQTPVTLTFTNADGSVIRSFKLHLKTQAQNDKKVGGSNLTPAQRKEITERKLRAIAPGMNRFQWDLRYPDVTEVNGYYQPFYQPAGSGDNMMGPSVSGPRVVPGTYQVTLTYGSTNIQRPFTVALDPRLNATPADLAASLELQLQINHTLDSFNKTINQALSARDGLQKRISSHQLSQHQAAPALVALNQAITAAVQLEMQSSEGDVMFPPRLRSWLGYLRANVGMAYVRPTAAQSAVFQYLDQKSKDNEQKLRAATVAANKLM